LNANEKKKESTHLKKQHLAKRQYFKPSIDGSWMANEQAMLLRREKQNIENENLKSNGTSSMAATNNNNCNCSRVQQTNNIQTGGGREKVTVKSLISSLVTLFDRVKAALLEIANKHN
jgi:hypothetical protein